ncbi:hypothetical protein BCR34DRAFT_610229 [Clohesyomyces aquaticus]|uniref:DUF7730 domain-containing protein n=1 Tax=Clohesyomyces aquaticus TaxID=1231657 RepID=A0A1Y2A7L5_9PLEO|nr:hypothetical protein BCR34DRAFT_610229 [Clohesyomyces aquaticus]
MCRNQMPWSSSIAGCLLCACGVICCFPVVLTFWGKQTYYRSDFNKKRLSKRKRTPPKVAKRKRALSFDGSEGLGDQRAEKSKQGRPRQHTTNSQEQSPLFKLPTELRMKIWEEAIGAGELHIFLVDKTLNSYRCKHPSDHRDTGADHCWLIWPPKPGPLGGCYNYPFRCHRPGIEVLALLQTSRRVYMEAIDAVYSTPTFQFHDHLSLCAFLGSLLPQRVAMIRRLCYNNTEMGRHGPSPWELTDEPDYSRLKRYNLTMRNPILPLIPDQYIRSKEFYPLNYVSWHLVCDILVALKGLRELEMRLAWLPVGLSYGLGGEKKFLDSLTKIKSEGGLSKLEVRVFN